MEILYTIFLSRFTGTDRNLRWSVCDDFRDNIVNTGIRFVLVLTVQRLRENSGYRMRWSILSMNQKNTQEKE